MLRRKLVFLLGLVAIPLAANWPSFRGPNATGIAPSAHIPDEWDGERRHNLRWKTPVPGSGHGSPIVSNGRVYVLTAVSEVGETKVKVLGDGRADPAKDQGEFVWKLLAFRLRDGKLVWSRDIHQGVPRSPRVIGGTYANSTPATDGKHIVVTVANEAIVSVDLDGNVLWKKDLGLPDPKLSLDPASSPLAAGGRVIVQCDWEKQGYLAAFDIASGRELWRTPRNDGMSWSSPALSGDVVVANSRWIRGYALESGAEVWRFDNSGSKSDRIPSPVVTPERIFFSGGGAEGSTVAISAKARGEIKSDSPEVVWSARSAPYLPTPLAFGDYLYVLFENGVLRVYRTATGERDYEQRVTPGRFSASPVAAEGRILLTDEEGVNYVIAPGPVYRLIRKNTIGEPCLATPAIAGDTIVVRTIGSLYAFRKTRGEKTH